MRRTGLRAKGLATGETGAHLEEIYDTGVSRETISKIADEVVADMAAWQNRPLDAVYPVLLLDAITVKVRGAQVANRRPRRLGGHPPGGDPLLGEQLGRVRAVPGAARRAAPRRPHHQRRGEPQRPIPIRNFSIGRDLRVRNRTGTCLGLGAVSRCEQQQVSRYLEALQCCRVLWGTGAVGSRAWWSQPAL